jgi:hypothetical protein
MHTNMCCWRGGSNDIPFKAYKDPLIGAGVAKIEGPRTDKLDGRNMAKKITSCFVQYKPTKVIAVLHAQRLQERLK